jgi:phosphate transport system substrate-binding protein
MGKPLAGSILTLKAKQGDNAQMTRRGFLITILAAAAALSAGASTAVGSTTRTGAQTLYGAGSSFVYPLVQAWEPAFQSTWSIAVNYQAVGSGAGIAAITSRSVDFGASDAPLTPDQETACNGCLTIPWAFSATSIAYQGSGLPDSLKITGPVLAKIYLGQITNWSDPAIKALNKGVSLPDKPITPIFRSDASGTSYNFTDYLSSISSEFKSKIGVGTQPTFSTGVGAAKSSGVSAVLAKTDGGICYVDVAYALQNHFNTFAVENRAGVFARPVPKNIAATAGLITKAKPNAQGLVLHVVNPPKPSLPKISKKNKNYKKLLSQAKAKNKKLAIAYPICTFTYVIAPTQAKQATLLKAFLNWALKRGQIYGQDLYFIPIPTAVKTASLGIVAKIQQAS